MICNIVNSRRVVSASLDNLRRGKTEVALIKKKEPPTQVRKKKTYTVRSSFKSFVLSELGKADFSCSS